MRDARSRFAFVAGLLLAGVPGIGSAEELGGAQSRDLVTPSASTSSSEAA